MVIPELRMVMSTDPLVADEKVFVIFNSELHAIDADTGEIIWSYEIKGSIAVADWKIFVSPWARDKIYVLDEDNGNLITSYEISDSPAIAGIRGPPAIAEGKIFVKSEISVQSYLFSVQEGIIEELEEELERSIIPEVPVPDDLKMKFRKNNISLPDYAMIEKSIEEGKWEIFEFDKRVINGEEMFIEKFIVKEEDGKLNIYAKCLRADKIYVLDEDSGKIIWSYDLMHEPRSIAVAPRKVFVGTEGNKIYALDEDTGDLIWSYKPEKYISSIAIADEKVFVGAGAGGEKIYCFGAAKGEKGVPRFEVIFASAGLLIGAYLLRRRVKNGK